MNKYKKEKPKSKTITCRIESDKYVILKNNKINVSFFLREKINSLILELMNNKKK